MGLFGGSRHCSPGHRVQAARPGRRAGTARDAGLDWEVDLEMKAKALANCEVKKGDPKKPWREDKGLMEFLRTL